MRGEDDSVVVPDERFGMPPRAAAVAAGALTRIDRLGLEVTRASADSVRGSAEPHRAVLLRRKVRRRFPRSQDWPRLLCSAASCGLAGGAFSLSATIAGTWVWTGSRGPVQ